MACEAITLTGIALDCGSVGGLATIYITDRQNVTAATVDADSGITSITMDEGTVFSEFNFRKGNANFSSPGTRSDENGTVFHDTTLEVKFNKMEHAKRTEMTEISKGNTLVIAKDMNGLYWFIGWSDPDLNTYVYANVNGDTGAAMADANQYTLTLMSQTPELPYQMASDDTVGTFSMVAGVPTWTV